MELGALQVHLGVQDGVDRRASKAHVAFEVQGLAELRAALQSSGLETRPGVPIPGFARFEVRDPFGNRLEFLERA